MILIATCFLAGRPHRDKDVYHDTLVMGHLVPRQSTIGLAAELSNDYPIQMYLARWDGIVTESQARDARMLRHCRNLRRRDRRRRPATRLSPPICGAIGYSSAPVRRRIASASATRRRGIKARSEFAGFRQAVETLFASATGRSIG